MMRKDIIDIALQLIVGILAINILLGLIQDDPCPTGYHAEYYSPNHLDVEYDCIRD